MAIEEVVAGPGCSVYRGKLEGRDCLLVRTGMGKERAESATQFVLQRYPVTAMISLGFAGALSPELTIGDVVVCSTMHCASGPEKGDGETEAYHADANLLALASQGAGEGTPRFRLGSGVTVRQLASSTQKTQALGHRPSGRHRGHGELLDCQDSLRPAGSLHRHSVHFGHDGARRAALRPDSDLGWQTPLEEGGGCFPSASAGT